MAIMIPSVISPEVKSSAERKIFEWFQNAPGTDKWIVLHSLGITTHNKVIYGETDFLVDVYKRQIKHGPILHKILRYTALLSILGIKAKPESHIQTFLNDYVPIITQKVSWIVLK